MHGTTLRHCTCAAALVGLALALMPCVAPAQPAIPDSREQITLSFAPVVRRAAPAVVNIYTKKKIQQRAFSPLFDDPFFKRFFGDDFPFGGAPRERVQNSLGSGVVVRPDGVVVTNNHVIEGAEEITVILSDRREFEAEIVLADSQTDLAVLRIDPEGENLPALAFGDSDRLAVGDLVLAIGNPFGVGQTVTSGIVSALARTRVGVADYRSFIQTDAAINPGNSGGALVSMDGRLVGINTAIFSRNGGSLGIGFAVPSNMVRAIVDSAIEGRPLVRPWLGFDGRAVTADLADAMGMRRPIGVIVEDVYEDGPAEEAGLRPGDIIVSVAGQDVEDMQALRFRLATRRIGESIEMAVLRKKTEQRVQFKLIAPPEDPPRNEVLLEGSQPLAGARIANLSPALVDELKLTGQPRGVIVIGVVRRSQAARIGLRPGDILVEINGVDIQRVRDVTKIASSLPDSWRIAVRRGDRLLKVEVR
ncbi:MAG: DegQ family serine endoprotease [Rhodospirillales bacterium]|nr:MAG: DegQ family serine endoprotease [Rhodospirillales bacterium]